MSDPWRAWMPLHCAKYLGDTRHLSTLEHGAYLLLIMHYWTTGSLPPSDRQLAQIAGLSLKQWTAVRGTIAAFFRDDWTHGRVERELAEAEEKYRKRAKAGGEGGRTKASNARAKDGKRPSIATAELEQCSSIKQIHSSDEEVWVSVRERVTAAFRAANSPNIPDTSRVEIWRSRGHQPEICAAVVAEIVAKKPSISRLSYFDQAIADAHAHPKGRPREGPTRSSHDGRHDVLAELRAAKDGKRDYDDTSGRTSGKADGGSVARLKRLP